jgi:acyl dehydratase
MHVFPDIAALQAEVGKELGVSDWLVVDQSMIDAFAEATGDFQWIHVDVARAAASPTGHTIAHGFLTLSLIAGLGAETYRVEKLERRLNYGLNKVRFPTPVPSGGRVRARFKLLACADDTHGMRITVEATVELEGSAKPACVAEQVAILFPG